MSALIDPGQFPVIAGDMAQLRTDARTIDDAGAGIAEVGALVHARWQRLEPVYRAPEAAALMSATEPVRTVTEAVGANFSDAGGILTVYADTVEALQQDLASLRGQADALRADVAAARPDGWEIVGDIAGNLALPVVGPIAAIEGVRSTLTEPWRDDPALVARNSALVTAVAELVAAYEEAQRRCATDLNALHGAAPVVADDGDGVPEPGEYGFTLEQYRTAAAEGGLPWGSQVAEPEPWFVDVVTAPWRFAQGAGDAVAGTAVGLAALAGYNPDSGFEHAGATAGTAWTNLGKLVLAAGTYLTPGGMLRDQAGVVPFLEPGEGGRILTDTGKALVAWDQWDDDPARAGGLAVTNIALAVVGTRGLGAGARSLGAAVQAGRNTGFASHVGAGLTRVGEAIGRMPTINQLVGDGWRRLRPSPAPNLNSLPDLHPLPNTPNPARSEDPADGSGHGYLVDELPRRSPPAVLADEARGSAGGAGVDLDESTPARADDLANDGALLDDPSREAARDQGDVQSTGAVPGFRPGEVPTPLQRDEPLPPRELDSHYHGEADPTNPLRAFYPRTVHYMSDVEREAHRVFVSDGLLRWADDGAVVDTTAAGTVHSGSGRAMFVMDQNGNLYVSLEQEVGRLHHSSFLAGQPVAGAGEIAVSGGRLAEVTRKSGHYRPTVANQEAVRQALNEQGVDPGSIDFVGGF